MNPDPPIITFPISGTAMAVIETSSLYLHHTYDGTDASGRAGAALSSATNHPVGYGITYRLTTDVLAAAVIWDYCNTVGSKMMREDNTASRKTGRALIKVADRIVVETLRAGWSAPTAATKPEPRPAYVVLARETLER